MTIPYYGGRKALYPYELLSEPGDQFYTPVRASETPTQATNRVSSICGRYARAHDFTIKTHRVYQDGKPFVRVQRIKYQKKRLSLRTRLSESSLEGARYD